jgi:hypothetical protein
MKIPQDPVLLNLMQSQSVSIVKFIQEKKIDITFHC